MNEHNDLKKNDALQRSLSAGHWFLMDTLMQRVLIFGTFFITARLLTPADYGIIALAAIYPGLLDSLTNIALETALTQKKQGEEKPYLNAVWTFYLLRNTLLCGIVFFTAPLIAHFFHNDDMVLLFRVSGLSLFFQGWTNIGQVLFIKNLDYRKLFLRDLAMYGTNSITSIIGAVILHSYWALFIGNAAGILAATVSTYFLNSFRPRFELSYTKLKPLIPYSRWIFGQGLVNRLSQTIEDVLVGRFATTTSIGLYGKAKTLANAPTSPLGNIIGKIGFSTIASVQDSAGHVREGFHKSFDLSAVVALSFLAAIFVAGDQLVRIILGPAWSGITPFLRILSVAATLDALFTVVAGMVFNALDKPRQLFQMNTLKLLCLGIFLPLLIPLHGTFGAALTLLIASVITNAYALILIERIITPNWWRIGETLLVIGVALLLPLMLATYLLRFPFANNHFGFLFLAGSMGCLYGCIIVFTGVFLRKGPYPTLMIILKSFITRGTGLWARFKT